jgi:30S ribosomal protein S31
VVEKRGKRVKIVLRYEGNHKHADIILLWRGMILRYHLTTQARGGFVMGKGDRRSRRGKIWRGTTGKRRPKDEPKGKVEVVEVKETTVKKK